MIPSPRQLTSSTPDLPTLLADSGIDLGDEPALLVYLREKRIYPCTTTARWRDALIAAWNIRQMKKVWRAQIAEIRANAPAFALGAVMGVIAFAVCYRTAVAGGDQRLPSSSSVPLVIDARSRPSTYPDLTAGRAAEPNPTGGQ
jgi:hypothetical protein